MIIKTESSSIDVQGDIKEFKTGIDPKNLEFITTLLSSNLYSQPKKSFIREIVSNAWDSHVEAGTTDIPVIVKFDYDNKSITIRDYGTGLSPERFETIFCNIGSSTKRESNEYLGGFGIGRFSALACSNTVYITSYFNGLSYHYIMIKSDNSIVTNLVATLPTEEKNGVEVTLKNLYNIRDYREALDCIIFFPNVYVDGVPDFNNIKIKKYNNFAISSTGLLDKILLGNVLYPLNRSLFDCDTIALLKTLDNTGIVIRFDIGELNITPNRENIIYNDTTISIITQRVKDAIEEMQDVIIKNLHKRYSDIFEYTSKLTSTVFYDFITNDIVDNIYYYKIPSETLIKCDITYNGLRLTEKELDIVSRCKYLEMPNFKAYYDGKFNISSISGRHTGIGAGKFLCIKNAKSFTAKIKSYIMGNYHNVCIFFYFTFDEFFNYVKNSGISLPIDTVNCNTVYILRQMYKHIMDCSSILDINTDSQFRSFLEIVKSDNKTIVTNINLKVYEMSSNGYIKCRPLTYKTFANMMHFISSLKGKGIIFNNARSNLNLESIVTRRGFYYITTSKKVIEALDKVDIPNRVDLIYLLQDKRVLPILSALRGLLFYEQSFVESLPDYLKNEYNNLKKICLKYDIINNSNIIGFINENNIKPDYYTLDILKKVEQYYKYWQQAGRVVINSIGYKVDILTAYLVLKNKYYRINYNVYKIIKENELIQNLTKGHSYAENY